MIMVCNHVLPSTNGRIIKGSTFFILLYCCLIVCCLCTMGVCFSFLFLESLDMALVIPGPMARFLLEFIWPVYLCLKTIHNVYAFE